MNTANPRRRALAAAGKGALALLAAGLAAGFPASMARALAGLPGDVPDERLSAAQAQVFRAWFGRIVNEQLRQGPSPRWQHRDCAGLVRFAVNEAFKRHDARWLRANGIGGDQLPPELDLTPRQRSLGRRWVDVDGATGAFVTALAMIQRNTRFVSKDINQAQSADLLFFDQADSQHLMVWLPRYIAYHTGTVTPRDHGLRAVGVSQLMQWKDPRWQPHASNPNFVGVFRLAFLAR